jgi:hypothetical protein
MNDREKSREAAAHARISEMARNGADLWTAEFPGAEFTAVVGEMRTRRGYWVIELLVTPSAAEDAFKLHRAVRPVRVRVTDDHGPASVSA